MGKNMNQQTEKNKKKKRIAFIITLAAVICIILFIVIVSCQPQQKNEMEALENGEFSQEPSQEGLKSGVISPDVQPSNLPDSTENTLTSESAQPSSGAAPKTTVTPQPKATQKPSTASKPQQQQEVQEKPKTEAVATPKPTPTPQPTKSGHYEKVWVVDKAAYSYEEDVYEEKAVIICNDCGKDITNNKVTHLKEELKNGGSGGFHVDTQQIKTGTKTVTVPEEVHYEEIWVED